MLNKIILGDCLEVLKTIEDQSVDLVFADPPYNMQMSKKLLRPNRTKVNGVQEIAWDQFTSFQSYDDFSLSWLTETQRVLKPSGTFWVTGTYHNIFRIGKIIQDLGLWILNDLIWAKTNPMPNFKGVRFSNAHETLIWAAKSRDSKYCFNYQSMKILNDDKQMTSIWNLPVCNGSERLKIENKTVHPTQKPMDLLMRVILASTLENDIILDPFSGTGTTAVVAKMLGRRFIGIEKDQHYLTLAQARLDNTVPLNINHVQLKDVKPNKRVSLGNLIQKGLLEVGESIYDKNLENPAIVCLDGSLIYTNEAVGSIHQVAEKIIKKPTNGWFFWYICRDDTLLSLNILREHYLEGLAESN
ncbi:RAMA superfamily domain-contaning DNA methylase [Candidatus Hepatincolaceae symbiont of Richtersius coronifer]